MKLLSNPIVKQALVTLAVVAVVSRIKTVHPILEKLFTGGVFNPTGTQNNTSTVV